MARAIFSRGPLWPLAAAGLTTRASYPAFARQWSYGSRLQALAFDAFAVFDPRPVFRSCEEAFPGRGSELAELWRARQFDYQWLRALAGTYADFWQITRSALEFAAQSLKLGLSGSQRDALMRDISSSGVADVPDALAAMRRGGKRLALLSNATAEILDAGVKNSGLDGVFQHIISTDRIRSFKPDPRAYQLGPRRPTAAQGSDNVCCVCGLGCCGRQVVWIPTFWNNRLNAISEQLSATPDGAGVTLGDLTNFLQGDRMRPG